VPLCLEGQCAVQIAVSSHADQLALDDSDVYWTTAVDPGVVAAAPKVGGTAVTLASNQAMPAEIAVDGAFVFWTNAHQGGVFKVPIGGGALITLAPGDTGSTGLALDAAYVYWANGNDAEILKVPKSGGSVVTLNVGVVQHVGRLRESNGALFWASSNASGPLVAMSVNGGAVVAVGSDPSAGLNALAVNTASIYWATGAELLAVPVGGSTLSTLFGGRNGVNLPVGLAVDPTDIYWADGQQGAILTRPLSGGSLATLLHGSVSDRPQSVAVDASNLYFTRQGANDVIRIAK
jgi:hypothetical protein